MGVNFFETVLIFGGFYICFGFICVYFDQGKNSVGANIHAFCLSDYFTSWKLLFHATFHWLNRGSCCVWHLQHRKPKGWPRQRGSYVSTTLQVHINHTATATNNTCTATLQGAHSNHTAATQQPQSSHIVGLLPTVQRGAYNLHRLQSAPSPYNTHILQLLQQVLQGVSKKRYFSDFLSYLITK